MGYIITAIIIGIVILIGMGMVAFGKGPDPETKQYARHEMPVKPLGLGIALGGIMLLMIVTAISSATIVEARTLSVQTSFGKYVGIVKPGLNWTSPWSQFERFETTLQPTDLNDFDGDTGDAVVVSFSAPRDPEKPDQKVLAGGGNGTISAIVNWQISEGEDFETGTRALWEKYRTFDRASNELVKAKAMEKIGDVANDLPANEATVNQTLIARRVQEELTRELKPWGIVVNSVAIRRIVLDEKTAASLQKIIDAINKTAAYAEEQKGSAIQNQTLKERAAVGALEEKANIRYCLDITNSWNVTENGPLPATWTCGLGGSDAGVLVQTK